MKRIVFIMSLLVAAAFAAPAQDCSTGFCPETLTVLHKQGDVSPVTADITYGVVESTLSGATACWITQNLGAIIQASSETDASVPARGWFWQFNRKQGYYYDGTTRTPSVVNWITSIDESSNWLAENDPCTLILGSNWHIPTSTEYNNVISNGSWSNYTNAFSSALKLHTGMGRLGNTGEYSADAGYGFYWSSTQDTSTKATKLEITSSSANTNSDDDKTLAESIRCIRTY